MVERVTITSGATGPDAPTQNTPAPAPAPAPEQSSKPEKPSWLPEKFWNAEKGEPNIEGLAKSYGELEKKQSGKKPDAKSADTPQGDEATDAAKAAADSAGLNFESLQNKFYETGQLDDSDYEALQKAGIPKSMVDNYIAGIQLQVQQFADNIVGTVGGKEQYAEMTTWAKDNLSADEIKAYNEAVNSGDYNRAVTAVKALKSDFTAARGSEPNLVSGKQTQSKSDAYDNWKQVSADMNKPEYQRDPAFRKSVQDKLGRSNLR